MYRLSGQGPPGRGDNRLLTPGRLRICFGDKFDFSNFPFSAPQKSQKQTYCDMSCCKTVEPFTLLNSQ